MTQPNDYGFGEEAALLKEQARKFFADTLPVDALHALVADDPTPDRQPSGAWLEESWQAMVDLGWTMLSVPEAAGGLGLPVAAVAGLVEEQGKAAFPSPLLSTLCAGYVLGAAKAQAALDEIVAGTIATLAITNAQGSWQAGDSDVTYADGKLNGTASYVQDARRAQRFLVSANTGGGIGLFWIAADTSGVTVEADAIIDLTRDQGRLVLEDVAATPVTDNGLAALNQAMPAVWTLLAADMVGAGEWQLQTTVDYVTQRQQFDKPLGFFQAVKHPLVDVMIQIDEAKSLVYNAACAIDAEPEKAAQFAHMAKASASGMAGYASGRSVQCHGGIGFTWECYVHLYFKRQKHSQMLFGDGSWHRARLADILVGAAA